MGLLYGLWRLLTYLLSPHDPPSTVGSQNHGPLCNHDWHMASNLEGTEKATLNPRPNIKDTKKGVSQK